MTTMQPAMYLLLLSLAAPTGRFDAEPVTGADGPTGEAAKPRLGTRLGRSRVHASTNETAMPGGVTELRRSLVRAPDGNIREMDVAVRDDKAFIDGDIYLGPADRLVTPGAAVPRANVLDVAVDLWPSTQIPYVIDPSIDPDRCTDDTSSSSACMSINGAIAEWEEKTPLRFVKRTNQSDYIRFVSTDDGCYSAVGRQGGGQDINLENGKCFMGAAIHEIGHALGLFHEQSRSDRDSFLDYDSDASEWGKGHNFSQKGTAYGAFDWSSVMLYGSFAFTANGDPTLRRKGTWSVRRNPVTGLFGWSSLRNGETIGISDVLFADFDGNGTTDALKLDGTSVLLASGTDAVWTEINTLSGSLTDIRVGQFDADPRPDLFYADGTSWYVSSAATGPWTKINTSSYTVSQLYFGDFDANGRTDVLHPDGSAWWVSWNGKGRWTKRNTSGHGHGAIAVGRFDGDASDDVFIADGSKWWMVPGGSSSAVQINASSLELADLALGDFDGDGQTDLLRQKGKEGWRVSYAGRSGWQTFGENDAPHAAELRIADTDDDGRDDVIAYGMYTVQRDQLSPDDVKAITDLYFGTWQMSKSGSGSWQKRNISNYGMAGLAFHDFDGDGKDDVFRSGGGKWWISSAASGGWTQLNSSGYTTSQVGFGDFDGDGKTDVFRADGSKWWVSWGGKSTWQQLNSSAYPLVALKLADLNGDGRTDVFLATGSEWKVSYSGSGTWVKLKTSAVTNMLLADFNGDDKADVLHANGTTWNVSYGGTTGWQQLNTSAYTIGAMRAGDFNGDDKADLVRADGSKWWVSWGGKSTWSQLNTSAYLLPSLGFGDFDGDGNTDVLTHFARFAK